MSRMRVPCGEDLVGTAGGTRRSTTARRGFPVTCPTQKGGGWVRVKRYQLETGS